MSIINVLFLISNIYWLIAFLYILYRAVRHTYSFIKAYRNGNLTNIKFNLQWLAYICFPFFKRYIYKDKK